MSDKKEFDAEYISSLPREEQAMFLITELTKADKRFADWVISKFESQSPLFESLVTCIENLEKNVLILTQRIHSLESKEALQLVKDNKFH